MFKITDNKGFQIKFENGWTVSVQWGKGNYCDNYDHNGEYGEPVPPSTTAEVAAWPEGGGEWLRFENGDVVDARYTPAQVLELMNRVSAFPS